MTSEDHIWKAIVDEDEVALQALVDLTIPSGELVDHWRDPLSAAAAKGDIAVFELVLKWSELGNLPTDRLNHALGHSQSLGIAGLLIEAGALPCSLDLETRYKLMDRRADSYNAEKEFVGLTLGDFNAGRNPRTGVLNPEEVISPYWAAMEKTRWHAISGRGHFLSHSNLLDPQSPDWSAFREGQSLTILPDSRVIEIGGVHPDYHGPDLFTYNDVILREPDGRVRFFVYPLDVFPPTAFHSATIVGDEIVIIGGQSNINSANANVTPVIALNTSSMEISAIPTQGEGPGQIMQHSAKLVAASTIRIWGGAKSSQSTSCDSIYELDLTSRQWNRI